MTSPSRSTEARRAARRPTAAPSTVRAESSGPVDAIVSDVSITGARISCSADLRVGQEVTVGLAAVGAVRGMVMWRRDDSYGIAFAQPLAEEAAARAFAAPTVVQLVGRMRNARPDGQIEEEDGELYAEGTGWISALVFIVIVVAIGTALALRALGWA